MIKLFTEFIELPKNWTLGMSGCCYSRISGLVLTQKRRTMCRNYMLNLFLSKGKLSYFLFKKSPEPILQYRLPVLIQIAIFPKPPGGQLEASHLEEDRVMLVKSSVSVSAMMCKHPD